MDAEWEKREKQKKDKKDKQFKEKLRGDAQNQQLTNARLTFLTRVCIIYRFAKTHNYKYLGKAP